MFLYKNIISKLKDGLQHHLAGDALRRANSPHGEFDTKLYFSDLNFTNGSAYTTASPFRYVSSLNIKHVNQEIWNKWLQNFKWIENVSIKKGWNKFKWLPVKEMESKGWDIHKLQIEKPATLEWVTQIEKTTNQTYPDDFKSVLCEYASAVRINWHMEEQTIQEFDEIFCGAGYGYVWDCELLIEIYKNYKGWLTNCWNDPNDPYGGIYYNKVPFISVPNGDLIAFEKKIVNGESAVIYLSHDDGELHGKRLAKNFIEFISKWSNIGLVGTEEWQLSSFYDFNKNEISSNNEQVKLWKSILNEKDKTHNTR